MKLIKIDKLFDIKYGNSLELINLERCEKGDPNSINFVSRTEKNNGISAFVLRVDNITPNYANSITVAVGGSVLSTFVQPELYYTGFHVLVLTPRKKMKIEELLFFAMCIRKNKYKYNYGRQANKTLREILIPENMPKSWCDLSLKKINKIKSNSVNIKKLKLNSETWKSFDLTDLFYIKKGERLNKEDRVPGNVPLVTSKDENQGVAEFINLESYIYDKEIFSNSISIDMFGNTFYHLEKYFGDDNVHSLVWKEEYQQKTNKYTNLFIVAILQTLKLKYSYGRQVRLERLKTERIKLPLRNNHPDWKFMEEYIKSLPYSAAL